MSPPLGREWRVHLQSRPRIVSAAVAGTLCLMCVPSRSSGGQRRGEQDCGAHFRGDCDRDGHPEPALLPAEQPVPVAHRLPSWTCTAASPASERAPSAYAAARLPPHRGPLLVIAVGGVSSQNRSPTPSRRPCVRR